MPDTWLAVSDETGDFDRSGGHIGVGVVVARVSAWASALGESVNGQQLPRLLERPIPLAAGAQHSGYHHVRDALVHWNQNPPGINVWTGGGVDASARHLHAVLQWLLNHPSLMTIGVIDRRSTIRERLGAGSNDPAMLLGKLTALPLKLIWPFIGREDRLLVAPGFRSEPINHPVQQRVRPPGAAPDGPGPGGEAADAGQRHGGGNRTLVSTLLDELGGTARQFGIDPARCESGSLPYLIGCCRELKAARLSGETLSAIADLAAALTLLTSRKVAHQLLLERDPRWTNALFCSLDQVADR